MSLNLSRPRPLLTKAGLTGLVTSIAGVLSFLGYSQQATDLSASTQTIVSVAIGVLLLLTHTVPALSAQKDVTPLSSPRSATGERLLPASSVGAAMTPPDTAPADDGLIPYPAATVETAALSAPLPTPPPAATQLPPRVPAASPAPDQATAFGITGQAPPAP